MKIGKWAEFDGEGCGCFFLMLVAVAGIIAERIIVALVAK